MLFPLVDFCDNRHHHKNWCSVATKQCKQAERSSRKKGKYLAHEVTTQRLKNRVLWMNEGDANLQADSVISNLILCATIRGVIGKLLKVQLFLASHNFHQN